MAEGRPARLRVLVVDDSVVARRMVASAIEADDDLEVAGVAMNGRVALAKIAADRPDVVVLDIEMPELDGFGVLQALRSVDRPPPVVVFSHRTARGAAETLKALSLGAAAFALKPGSDERPADEVVRTDLLPLVKALGRPRVPAPPPRLRTPVPRTAPVSAVVVAVSTGGPNALAAFLPSLPTDLRVPVLVVQHMPPTFTAMLAQRLDGICGLTVTEAEDGCAVLPGHVYVAPGGRHLGLVRDGTSVRTVLHDGPPENSCRPSADVLFRAAAQAYGGSVLAVVMTGMGRDGLRGTETIVSAGGTAIAQDQATSIVGSMPGAVADAGLVDAVVPLDELAGEVVRRVSGPGART